MNARMQELAQQCHVNPSEFDYKKFSELLVQECMSCVTWVGTANTQPVKPINTAHAINKRIQQRLGVKL